MLKYSIRQLIWTKFKRFASVLNARILLSQGTLKDQMDQKISKKLEPKDHYSIYFGYTKFEMWWHFNGQEGPQGAVARAIRHKNNALRDVLVSSVLWESGNGKH